MRTSLFAREHGFNVLFSSDVVETFLATHLVEISQRPLGIWISWLFCKWPYIVMFVTVFNNRYLRFYFPLCDPYTWRAFLYSNVSSNFLIGPVPSDGVLSKFSETS